MEICSCGQFSDGKKPQCPRCEALDVLGLGTDAAENEIRRAYRVLSKAWSPENFPDDPKLKEAAERKLQDVHTAFIYLTPISTEIGRQQRPIYLSTRKASTAAQNAESAPVAASSNPATPDSAADTNPFELPPKSVKHYKIIKLVTMVAALAVLLLTGVSIWTAFKDQSHRDWYATKVAPAGNAAPTTTATAKKSFWDALIEELKKLDPRNPEPEPDQQTAPQNAKIQKPVKAPPTPPKAQPATHKIEPYLTLGSTREEALALQGPPTTSSDDKLVYGKSELYLKDGSIVGWRIDQDSSPIRVKLWPHSSVDPDQKSYTVGSSKDEVLVIQGTPTAFTGDTFEYGRSIVYFQNNRVTRWKEDPASVTLWAR